MITDKTREQVARHLQTAGQFLAGARGGRIANRVSTALRCGSITACDSPSCPNCALLVQPETEESLEAMHAAYEAADQAEYAAYMDDLDDQN